jgi:hypothetical protein
MRPNKRSGLSTVEIPDKDEKGKKTDDPDAAKTWRTITDPKEIETRLLSRNIAHFGQANDTLFASPECQRTFGYTGTGDIVEKLLRGEYEKIDTWSATTTSKIR